MSTLSQVAPASSMTADIVNEFVQLIDNDKEYDLKELKALLSDVYKTKTAKPKVTKVTKVAKTPKTSDASSDDEEDKPKKRGRPAKPLTPAKPDFSKLPLPDHGRLKKGRR